jgi:hypothetical protein
VQSRYVTTSYSIHWQLNSPLLTVNRRIVLRLVIKAGTDPWHSVSIGGVAGWISLVRCLPKVRPNPAQVAQPVLSEGTSDIVAFIIALRAENAAAADSSTRSTARKSATDPSSDASSVLLLTAPLVSPTMLVVVDASGSTAFRSLTSVAISPRAQNAIPADLQSAILSTSAEILLRRSSQVLADGGGRTAVAYFFALSRLMPLFASTSAQLSPALQRGSQNWRLRFRITSRDADVTGQQLQWRSNRRP